MQVWFMQLLTMRITKYFIYTTYLYYFLVREIKRFRFSLWKIKIISTCRTAERVIITPSIYMIKLSTKEQFLTQSYVVDTLLCF